MNPFKKRKDGSQEPTIILDTCALIDGRIVEIARAGFVTHNIVVPQFIIAELQFLADHGDSHKRERARYGMDVIRILQDLRRINVLIAREQFKDVKEVDDKLIALAKEYGRSAMLYTTDYNLNKVAQIEGVSVLNVNELAQALRPNWLPGERVEIKIIQAGQDTRQGVGYLEDGTMVVVEDGGNKIGQRLVVECKRMLQTQAGKMMFAVIPHQAHQQKPAQQKKPHHNHSSEQAPAAVNQPAAAPKAPHEQPKLQTPWKQNAPKPHPAPRNAQRGPQPQRQSRQVYHAHRPRKDSPEDSLLKAIEQSK